MARIVTEAELTDKQSEAASSPRLRTNLNLHSSAQATVQRMVLALQPSTYIRPHRHPEPNKWEMIVMLAGELELLLFSDEGVIEQRICMLPSGSHAGCPTSAPVIEIPACAWHSFICKQPNTLALEVKEGPYAPTNEQDFASWAPAEFSESVGTYLSSIAQM